VTVLSAIELANQRIQILCKWRTLLTGWQLGTRPKGDPEGDAVRDTREALLILRAEVTAISALLIRKGIYTNEEFTVAVGDEAAHLDGVMSRRFPGVHAHINGLTFTAEGAETMRRMNFKP
jgi:hypothetical protein